MPRSDSSWDDGVEGGRRLASPRAAIAVDDIDTTSVKVGNLEMLWIGGTPTRCDGAATLPVGVDRNTGTKALGQSKRGDAREL